MNTDFYNLGASQALSKLGMTAVARRQITRGNVKPAMQELRMPAAAKPKPKPGAPVPPPLYKPPTPAPRG